jgi:hypothetical protein
MATELRRFGVLAVIGAALLALHFAFAGNPRAAEVMVAVGVATAMTLAGTRRTASVRSKRRA